ncbi:MAG: CAP domain-containing protein [Candidatus Paceibacterota bacterium]
MSKHLKRWLIPSESNNHEPHFLRTWSVVFLLVIIVAFFGVAQLLEENLKNVESGLAAVVSSVLVDLTNFDRAQEGLHGLAFNQKLKEAAQLKANDMAVNGYFAHNSPSGVTPWFWLDKVGYEFAYAGENLAVFFGDSEDVARAWMDSPTHRANILSSNFSEIGIATAEGYYQGHQTIFVVQMFGTPHRSASVATLTNEPSQDITNSQDVVRDSVVEVATEKDVEPVAPEPVIDILHQDDTFIAVKGDVSPAPSNESVEMQSTFWERIVASPQTTLSYIYTVIASVVAVSLVLLIFSEMHIQKPKNIILGLTLLAVLGTLLYFSYSEVIVASMSSSLGFLYT